MRKAAVDIDGQSVLVVPLGLRPATADIGCYDVSGGVCCHCCGRVGFAKLLLGLSLRSFM